MRPSITITITGQIRGGKNGVKTTRTGRRYPNPKWAQWRDSAVSEVVGQLPDDFQPFTTPASVRLDYVAGDRRRRDFPAICDSVWHVLEKAGVVTDDTLLWPTVSSRDYSKANPRCEVTIKEEE